MVMKLASGTPFTVTGGATDLNFDGFAERAALVDPSVLGRGIDNPNTSQQRLPASAFRLPTPADLGCCILGRNTFYGDGVKNFDFGIYKNFNLPFEGQKITLRMELYNAFSVNSDFLRPTSRCQLLLVSRALPLSTIRESYNSPCATHFDVFPCWAEENLRPLS